MIPKVVRQPYKKKEAKKNPILANCLQGCLVLWFALALEGLSSRIQGVSPLSTRQIKTPIEPKPCWQDWKEHACTAVVQDRGIENSANQAKISTSSRRGSGFRFAFLEGREWHNCCLLHLSRLVTCLKFATSTQKSITRAPGRTLPADDHEDDHTKRTPKRARKVALGGILTMDRTLQYR